MHRLARAAPRAVRTDRPLLVALGGIALLVTGWLSLAGAGAGPRLEAGPGHLVVAELRGQALAVIDFDGRLVQRVALPGGPHELVELPDGRIVASLEQSGALAVVDLDRGVVATIAVGGLPHGLAFDGQVLLVTDRSRNAVRRFALEGWRELAPVATGQTPHAVAVAGGTVAVANAADGTLLLDGHVLEVSALPETVAATADGARVAVAGALGGYLHVLDAEGRRELEVRVGARPVRVVFAPDGRTVAAALSAEGAVGLVDAAGRLERIAVGGVPDGLAFDRTGSRLYASDVAGGVVTAIDLANRQVAWRLDVGASAGALLVLRD